MECCFALGELTGCPTFKSDKWPIYKRVLITAIREGIPFALGGGLATMIYTGRFRRSKDIDIYVMSRDRGEIITVLNDCGLADYYEKQPYDRAWIYRSYTADAIVDVIWAMANQRTTVDRIWLDGGSEIVIDDLRVRLVPPEETLWSKLYVLQYDRCDWPDALNLLFAIGPELDWRCLLERVGDDSMLLGALLSVFAWMCPEGARALPCWVWSEIGVSTSVSFGGSVPIGGPASIGGDLLACSRANLLDTRPWFPVGERQRRASIKAC